MRALRRNTQRLWYSVYGEPQPIYEKDEYGNIIYDEMPDGNLIPRDSGEMTNGYEMPIEFHANISASGGKTQDKPYGIDLSGYDAVLYSVKGTLPINEESLIWQEEPIMLDDCVPDPKRADYVVRRVPTCLNEVIYLLERVPK